MQPKEGASKICLVSGSPECVFFQNLPLELPKSYELEEHDEFSMSKLQHELDFPVWPVLSIKGKYECYGVVSILYKIFPKQCGCGTVWSSLITLGKLLYENASIVSLKSQSVIVSSEIVEKAEKLLQSTISSFASIKTGDNPLVDAFVDSFLSVAVCLGANVNVPFKTFNLIENRVRETAASFCFNTLQVPEYYEMSPPPQKPLVFTTPIYYVNGRPHIGHIFTTTLVDCLTKWYKIRGIDCIYSTGTDEHGLKVQTTAQKEGFSPKEWCDKTTGEFRDAFKDFDLHPDIFIRTTDDKHVAVAIKLWEILVQKGYIYKGTYEGWYSKREETFIPETQIKEVIVDGVAKKFNIEDDAELEWSSETNYMFKLSSMQEPLLDWLNRNPNCVTPSCYYNLVKSQVLAGLVDISLSRTKSRVSWGIPVPNDDTQTMYVWIDALANYLTICDWDGVNMGKWPADMHVVGKDILKFHAIYWPAFLIAAGVPVYKRLLVHGWWTKDETKMSKSLGNTLDPFALVKFWGLDELKYYLLREVTLVSDSDYSDHAMLSRLNNDLADSLGNLLCRVCHKNICPSLKVPKSGNPQPIDLEIINSVKLLPGTIDHLIAFGKTRRCLEIIFSVVSRLNKYIVDIVLWKLEEGSDRKNTILYTIYESCRIFLLCLVPFIPRRSEALLKCFDQTVGASDDQFRFGVLEPGTKVSEPIIKFSKKSIT